MEVTNETLAVGVGMFTVEQAAVQLYGGGATQAEAVLLTKRLIARRSLPSVKLGEAVRVPMAGLTAFMADNAQNSSVRNTFGLPMETIRPLFPFGRDGERTWFNDGPESADYYSWRSGLDAELTKLMPQRAVKATPDLASSGNDVLMVEASQRSLFIDLSDPRFGLAALKPLRVIIESPAPAGSPFKSLGEILVAKRLQELAVDTVRRRQGELNVSVRAGIETETDHFYGSPEDYGAILGAALDGLKRTACLSVAKCYSEVGVHVVLQIGGAMMLKMTGSSEARIGCLAF
jgi:hypothetical protein